MVMMPANGPYANVGRRRRMTVVTRQVGKKNKYLPYPSLLNNLFFLFVAV